MANNASESSSASESAVELGAVSATQKLVATLHVTAVTGTSPTLDVTIESDASDSFAGGETTQITFTTVSAVGSQTIEINGAVTDTWFREEHTIGGTTPGFDYVVTLGIVDQ